MVPEELITTRHWRTTLHYAFLIHVLLSNLFGALLL